MNNSSIRYNSKLYKGQSELLGLIKSLCSSADKELVSVGRFIKEWFNSDDEITLKTSGSTGEPKKICVRKSSMIASAKRTLQFFNLKANNTALLCLSANYIAGKMMIVRAIVGDLNLIQGHVNSNPLLDIDYPIDFAAMVPLQVSSIVNANEKLIGNIKNLIIGGARVDSALSQKLHKLQINAWETYGMTETVSHIALRRVAASTEPFSLLSDLNISQDKRQCIVIEPSDINPNRLITNDVVELINEHQFILKGRIDNVINSGGVKIHPEMIEEKLKLHINQELAITSVSDPLLGEKLVLIIEGSKIAKSMIDSAFKSLSKYEQPKVICYTSKLPKTQNGKIQRYKLSDLIS